MSFLKWIILLVISIQYSEAQYNQFYLDQFSKNTNICESDEWLLVFHDEFEGTEINHSNWFTYSPNSSDGSDQCCDCRAPCNANPALQQIFRDENVIVNNGKLFLRATNESNTWFNVQKSYKSGLIYGKQNFKFGKFEINCKIPKGNGFFPAFWLFNTPVPDESRIGELDIFENQGGNTNEVDLTVHDWTAPCDGSNHNSSCWWRKEYNAPNNLDLSLALHTYAVEWDEYFIYWKIDGQTVFSLARLWKEDLPPDQIFDCSIPAYYFFLGFNLFPTTTMRIIADLAIAGGSNSPDGNTIFPSDFEIEYIRVYQRKSHIQSDLVDLCDRSIEGDNIVCSNTEHNYTLSSNNTEGLNASQVSWEVSNGLIIVSSSNNEITVRGLNGFSGTGWIKANVSGELCGNRSFKKDLNWIGNPPGMNFDYQYNCWTKCFQIIPHYDHNIVSSYYVLGNAYRLDNNYRPDGSLPMNFDGLLGGCPLVSNYNVFGTIETVNECGSTIVNIAKQARCRNNKFIFNPALVNTVLSWKIEDDSDNGPCALSIIYVVSQTESLMGTINTGNINNNEWNEYDVSNFPNGTYYMIGSYSDGETLNEAFQVFH